MKIYVSAPNEDRIKLKSFFASVESLIRKGHKIIDIYKNEKLPLPDDVDYLVTMYKQSEKALREADILLLDVTYPGRRIGFEVARGLDERKFVIALYDEDASTSARRIAPLLGNTSKNIFYKGYTADTVDRVIEEGLKHAREQLDTKFILIISPEIDKYLEWSASERRMHKAQVVREAIESILQRDKEYQAFLKDLGN